MKDLFHRHEQSNQQETPLLFIRFNPHSYTKADGTRDVISRVKENTFRAKRVERGEALLQALRVAEGHRDLLTVQYMYYDVLQVSGAPARLAISTQMPDEFLNLCWDIIY